MKGLTHVLYFLRSSVMDHGEYHILFICDIYRIIKRNGLDSRPAGDLQVAHALPPPFFPLAAIAHYTLNFKQASSWSPLLGVATLACCVQYGAPGIHYGEP